MVTVKDAVGMAIEFAQSVLGSSRTVDLRLEEVESIKVNGDDAWSITLSMPEPQTVSNLSTQLAAAFGKGPREYKTFTVNAATGQVLSMKIRELAGAD